MGDGGVTDGVKIGIAHGNGQGAVLGEIEVLARERRKNRRQGLRQHNPTQPKPFSKPKAAEGLPLAPRHRIDATAHDLGNRCTREHREPHKNRTKFNAEVQAQQLNALIRKLSNQGIQLLGLNLSVEFCAVLVGLTVFTGASIAEIVRGGINAVPRGQWEAFRSLGLGEGLGLRRIVLPQALPAILPALTSQYLNLAKNSTLAIAVGYADLYAVSDTTITQTGRAIEGFLLLLLSFLLLNLLISGGMAAFNRAVLGRLSRSR